MHACSGNLPLSSVEPCWLNVFVFPCRVMLVMMHVQWRFQYDLWSTQHKSAAQRPRKRFESGEALAKRGTFLHDQNETILCRLRAERKFLKIWSLYTSEMALYYCNALFTTAKRALSFQQNRAFIQEILFSFFKWGTLAQKKEHFFSLLKKWEGTCPYCPPVLRPLSLPMPFVVFFHVLVPRFIRNSICGSHAKFCKSSGRYNEIVMKRNKE
jgi:hypothetical protein